MFGLLTRPCPPIRHRWQAFMLAEVTIIVMLTLSLTRLAYPFDSSYIVMLLADIGISVVVAFIIIIRMPIWLNPERWMLWKFLACFFVGAILMSSGLFLSEMLFEHFYGRTLHVAYMINASLWRNLLNVSAFNFIAGTFIAIGVYYYISIADLKILLQEETAINRELVARLADRQDESEVDISTVELGTGKNAIHLQPSLLYYIESAGNYVNVHYMAADGKLTQKLVRFTILQAEATLRHCRDIVRCHRAFIVNLNNVEKATNNRQSLLLRMKNGGKTVPVSRSYRKNLQTPRT